MTSNPYLIKSIKIEPDVVTITYEVKVDSRVTGPYVQKKMTSEDFDELEFLAGIAPFEEDGVEIEVVLYDKLRKMKIDSRINVLEIEGMV